MTRQVSASTKGKKNKTGERERVRRCLGGNDKISYNSFGDLFEVGDGGLVPAHHMEPYLNLK